LKTYAFSSVIIAAAPYDIRDSPNPMECIDSGVCIGVCPVEAICSEDNVSEEPQGLNGLNTEMAGNTAKLQRQINLVRLACICV
jgi:ferredoxin